jgi:hypothetical protein
MRQPAVVHARPRLADGDDHRVLERGVAEPGGLDVGLHRQLVVQRVDVLDGQVGDVVVTNRDRVGLGGDPPVLLVDERQLQIDPRLLDDVHRPPAGLVGADVEALW